MANFTASVAVRWLDIQLQCTSGLARRAAASKLQRWCPASPAACVPSRMLYHIRCTDWQSVMTVPQVRKGQRLWLSPWLHMQ
jgi:hypothetical protein